MSTQATLEKKSSHKKPAGSGTEHASAEPSGVPRFLGGGPGQAPDQTLDSQLPLYLAPVQMKCAACAAEEEDEQPVQMWDCSDLSEPTCTAGEDDVQTKEAPGRSPRVIHSEARRGLAAAASPLPHGDRIQAAFGRHDVSAVRANIGGDARSAAENMGALAFTAGDRIGFRGTPDLRLAAHEAAHTVQQRAGLQLPDNISRVGDPWEQHADRVAEAVVEGRSAEALLDDVTEPGTEPNPLDAQPVQQQITAPVSRIIEPPPPVVEAPAPEADAGSGGDTGSDEGSQDGGSEDKQALDDAEGEAAPEAAPPGVTVGGGATPLGETGPPADAPPADSGGAGGGGINAPCYNVDPPPEPKNAEKPKSDAPPAEAQAEPQVHFDAWPDKMDQCPPPGMQQAPPTPASAAPPKPESTDAAPPAEAGTEAGTDAKGQAEGGAGAGGEAGEGGLSAGTGLDGAISGAESARDAAVADYEAASSTLEEVPARARGLSQRVQFPSGEGSREAANTMREFLDSTAGQIESAVAFARFDVPQRLGSLADAVQAVIQGAIEMEKSAVSGRIAQARVTVTAAAAEARALVSADYITNVAQVIAETATATAAVNRQHDQSLSDTDEKETTGLQGVNSKFATGRKQHEDKGPEYSGKALEIGQQHAHAYERCKTPPGKGAYDDDGFWNGCLTVRRAKAQQDVACKTAAGYKKTFLATANKKAFDLKELRTLYRCAVISGARDVRKTLDDTHEKLVSGLAAGQAQTLKGLAAAHTLSIAAINSGLAGALASLSKQECTQRQTVNDTGYLQQLSAQQAAHSAAANLAWGISGAMETLDRTLAQLRDRISRGTSPDPAALARMLAGVEDSLGGGMGSLLGSMEQGAAQAELQIAALGAAALGALSGVTASNDEAAGTAESGFAAKMSGLSAGASSAFAKLAGSHIGKAKQAGTEGVDGLKKAVTGFDTALASIGSKIDAALQTSLQGLDKELSGKLGGLDSQIASEAWKAASKEQPAWKKVLAIVLIIVVIIASVVISIVTLGAGASLFAMILVGALVGAVSGGLIQILSNWSSGEDWDKGLAQAIIMGAVGGAIGGGFGGLGGAFAQGASRVVTRLAITVTADLAAEAATQTFGYVALGQKFNWQGFVMAAAMSGVSFRAHPATPPRSSMRAAAGQAAAGAAVGLGVEVAGSALSGEKFDPTRAASAAATGAVAARASRVSHGATPHQPEAPRGPMDRFRAFDPGGVGQRLTDRATGLGQRLFGGPTPVAPETHAQPRPAAEEAETAAPPKETPQTSDELPTRPAGSEPIEADPKRPANQLTDAELADPPVRVTVGDAEHDVTIRRSKDGKSAIWLCSAECGQMLAKVDALLERPGVPPQTESDLAALRGRIEAVQADIDAGRKTAGEVRGLKNELAMELDRLGRTIPGFGEALNLRPVSTPSTAAVDVASYLPEGFKAKGPQQTVQLGPGWQERVKNLGLRGREAVYVVRDAETGRVLKVGKTEDALSRLKDYNRAEAPDMYGRPVLVDVLPVEVPRKAGSSLTKIEDAVRARVEAELRAQPGVTSREVLLADGKTTKTVWYDADGRPLLEWDNTGQRLGREGPGTPGVITEDMSKNIAAGGTPDPLYWRRNAQGIPEIVSTSGAGPRPAAVPQPVIGAKPSPGVGTLQGWKDSYRAQHPGGYSQKDLLQYMANRYQQTRGETVSTGQVRRWLEKENLL